MRKELGFSVLETLTIVLALAVLAAIAVPRVVQASRTYQLRSSAQQVAQLIQAAKFDAVSKSTKQKLLLDMSQNTIATSNGRVFALADGVNFQSLPNNVAAPEFVQSASQNSDALPGQESDGRMAVSLPTWIFPQTHELTFTSNGLPEVEPGVVHWIYLANEAGERMAVTMTSAGSVAMLTWQDGKWA